MDHFQVKVWRQKLVYALATSLSTISGKTSAEDGRHWTRSSNTFFDCLESGAEEFQIHHVNWLPISISAINRSVLAKARAYGGKRR